ncbi:GILT-like protein 1 [Sitodiplosis mosellana]|uniref:GILT-like protein 1 n=1 Tax=Sitodiplosis mosellana TaxID=263140 RepID=UPI002443AB57|nr:GILT-like protein 1 [Sitodiplosis mosellana]
MKFFICTVFAVLMAVAMAHPPSSEHEHEHEHHHDEKHDDGKPITEPSTEARAASTDDSSALPVTVYYEGLCPDSRKLWTDLGRDYYLFKKYINLEFIPFGRAKSLDAEGNEFECHHGPKECLANRIHSCGVKYLKSQDARQQFVVCQMRTEADQTGKECLEEAGGDWTEVSKCVDGDESKKLQLQAERDTKKISVPRLESVPTIVFNNELNQELNNKAFKNLKAVFCELLSTKNIPECA